MDNKEDENKEKNEYEDDNMEVLKINSEEKKFSKNNKDNKKDEKAKKASKYNYNNNNHEIIEKDELPTKPMKRSEFSLEGAKYPLSIYTRRVMDISKLGQYLNKDSSAGICGGRNLGNTCYMNSSIACISNCTELTYYFLCGDYLKDINYSNENGMKGILAKIWGNLLEEYWVDNTDVRNPSQLKSIIGQKAKRFRGFGQQDSNEFMSIFLDYLNEDLNSVSKKEYIELDEKKDSETDEECSKRFWDANLKRNDSIVTDLFCGQFKSTITCPKCKRVSITFEPFYSINLPIKGRKKHNKLTKKILKEYRIYYMPKYCIRDIYLIKYNDIPNITTLKECYELLKNEDTFKYKEILDEANYMKIEQKQFGGKGDEDDILEEDTQFYFYEIVDKENNDLRIPIYLLYENEEGEINLSFYPRFATGNNDMTLEDLKKSIYFNIRKYILSPFLKYDEEIDEISAQINKYISDMSIQDEYIFDLINEEYKQIFEDKNLSEEKIEQLLNFINDMPFNLTLREAKGKNVIKILDDSNLNAVSKEFKEMTRVSSLKDKLLDCLFEISDYVLAVEFNINSKYINTNNFKLDFTLTKKIQFPKNEEEEKKVEEEEEDYRNQNLTKSLINFCKEEQLKQGNEWYCNVCKEHVLPKIKMDIYYLPKILIICFKRFIKGSMEKNEENIDFPINNFDMKDLMIGPDKDHSVYDLFAVSQHYGSTVGGHYTAVCKNGNDWYNYDDSSVSKTSAKSVLTSAAYVLFYRRKTD
jgi:ubiquitin carboxyl-terminal hydrolase 4/11/15